MSQVNLITLSLSPPYPDKGIAPVIVRLAGQDKYNLDLAAAHMGLSKAVLMRILLIRGAETILRELGIKAEYEQDKYRDLAAGDRVLE